MRPQRQRRPVRGQNLTFWTKGSDAMLERYGQPTLNCSEIPGN